MINKILFLFLSFTVLSVCAHEPRLSQCEERLLPTVSESPIYPSHCRNCSGPQEVVVGFVVLPSGKPSKLSIVSSSSNIFDKSALKAVSKFIYPKRDVACIQKIKLVYTLE